MPGPGRISLLVSEELRQVAAIAQQLDGAMSSQLNAQTRRVAEPVWQEEVRSRVSTRLQSRVLLDSARVSVTRQNVFLKSAGTGRLTSGTKPAAIAGGAEWGAAKDRKVKTRSSKGKRYERRMGGGFGPNRRAGKVIMPSVGDVIPRIASLWAQTAYRTVAELFERGGR